MIDAGCAGVRRSCCSCLFVIREQHGRRPDPADGPDDPADDRGLTGGQPALVGAILFGLDTYVPLYMQGVRGGDATLAGRALMPLFLAWAISVAVAARAVVHFGFRRGGHDRLGLGRRGEPRPGGGARSSPTGLASGSSSGWRSCGLGMGPTSLSFILAVQHAVSWGQRGVATGAVDLSAHDRRRARRRPSGRHARLGAGAPPGAIAGATGIDVAAALRPETHKSLTADAACAGPGQPRPDAPRRLSPDGPAGGRIDDLRLLAARQDKRPAPR